MKEQATERPLVHDEAAGFCAFRPQIKLLSGLMHKLKHLLYGRELVQFTPDACETVSISASFKSINSLSLTTSALYRKVVPLSHYSFCKEAPSDVLQRRILIRCPL